MKVLLLHNFYGSRSPSGENQVFEAERDLLLQHGHEVQELTRHSDEIYRLGMLGVLKGALTTVWNPFMARAVGQVSRRFAPDIVHVHNTFPLLSPSVFHALERDVPRVLTLHNYRLFCAAAIPLRSGKVCTDCIDRRTAWPAVLHGCYRNSRLATIPIAASIGLHRSIKTWSKHVDAFIVLSEYQREMMIGAGIPADRLHLKPNFLLDDGDPLAWTERDDVVVYAGRLSSEKGIESLIEAWTLWGEAAPYLHLFGDGPLLPFVQEAVRRSPNLKIKLFGKVPQSEVRRQIRKAKLVVLPSIWFETFGMVVLEAFACGTPTAVSDIGSLPSLVRHGHCGPIFQPGNAASMFAAISSAWRNPGVLESQADHAIRTYRDLYTASANYRTLLDIYERAIAVRQTNS